MIRLHYLAVLAGATIGAVVAPLVALAILAIGGVLFGLASRRPRE